MPVIDDPAAAAAAALCLIAQDRDGVTRRHPRRCSWCDYPAGELRRMVEGFSLWAAWDEKRRTYGRHDARVFAELPRERQAELVLEAQGFDPEPDPMPGPPEPSPDDSGPVTQEEPTVPSWFAS